MFCLNILPPDLQSTPVLSSRIDKEIGNTYNPIQTQKGIA